ncbi:unnamed protein product [Phytophthora lilii]|uniref:Unnamed protein product n=1 Tax=Phytophthora lilii TaxID=2077276 RepID=A0A9W6TSX8_9STRA|nr:unnamed protein product [Phytophthora lilii]
MPVDTLPMTTQGIALVPGTNNDISGIGALSCSSLTVNGSTVSSAPSYVVSITPGTVAINKALVLGASGEIGTISELTATQITGTLQTAAKTNITSLGTLSGLTIAGNLAIQNVSTWTELLRKTNLVMFILKHSPNVFAHLNMIARNPNQPIYDYLKEKLEGFITFYDEPPNVDSVRQTPMNSKKKLSWFSSIIMEPISYFGRTYLVDSSSEVDTIS